MGTASSWSILVGFALIAAAILGAKLLGGRDYQIVSATGADGNPFVWRLDVRSGAIESCAFQKEANPFDDLDPAKDKDPFAFLAQSKHWSIKCTGIYKP